MARRYGRKCRLTESGFCSKDSANVIDTRISTCRMQSDRRSKINNRAIIISREGDQRVAGERRSGRLIRK